MNRDMPLKDLLAYSGNVLQADDFNDFWEATIAKSRLKFFKPKRVFLDQPLAALSIEDVTFSGFDGQPIKAWLRRPAGRDDCPTVVLYHGYGRGRGYAMENLLLPLAGFAVLDIDTRGQGAQWGIGDTPDEGSAGPQVPGFITRGIQNRDNYYYRRLITDAVMAIDALAYLPLDNSRVGVMGGSQGGYLSMAAGALCGSASSKNTGGSGLSAVSVSAVVARVPFMCDIARAIEVTDTYPFRELSDYLATHRLEAAQVFDTLSYFDGVNFARHLSVPVDFSVGLADSTVPASTVFAAYNACPLPPKNSGGVDVVKTPLADTGQTASNSIADKHLLVWSYNGHESGGFEDELASLNFFKRYLGNF